ncbi:MAG: lipoprotein-releasing system permease protein [Rickettsiales bacterium]|jgi:lipoprotein-releasing system permease protein
MFSKLEFLIALRYLKAKRSEGFISVIAIFSFVGIMIGVATLIIVMSVMNGFRFELVNRILGINSHLTVYSRDGNITDYQAIIDKLKTLPTLEYANPIIESQTMLTANGKASGGLVKAIKLPDLKHKKLITDNIIFGKIDAVSNKNEVIIGSGLAGSMRLDIGDEIKIISSETNNTILGAIPRIKTYEVGGVFESGMYEYDSSTVFMNFKSAAIHFRAKDSVSAIEIFGSDATNIENLKYQVNTLLRNDFPNLYLIDWQQANSGFIDALKVERTVMFMILTLIILVAAFNIISSLIMLVGDKKKNIACMRTMGMSRSSVMKIFLICGSLIGSCGTLLGLFIGVIFSININNIKQFLESMTGTQLFNPAIYFLSNLPAKIFLSDVLTITLMALILSFLATLYPAFKASRANPADILRYE